MYDVENFFPPKDGVYNTLLPRTLVTSKTIAYGPVMTLPFAQISVEGDNSMRTRTVGGVALRPTGNIQGGVRFLILDTGSMISARK